MARRPGEQAIAPVVAIDARMVGDVPHGMARYVTRLASGISALGRVYPLSYEPVFFVPEAYGAEDFQGFRAVRLRSPFLASRELFEIPDVLRRLGAALYHSPSFSSLAAFGPWRAPCPWIATVHDLNHLVYGDWKRRLYYRILLRPFARGAGALVTVSEFSRRELAGWTGRPETSIEIVYNSLDPGIPDPEDSGVGAVLARHGLERGRYFLCVSNPKPHKNIGLLVEAYQESREGEPSAWPLVLTMSEFGDRPGVRALGGLRDEEARALRAGAGAVVFPSLYEGFGLPPLEAVLAGAPLIVSRIPPHQEGLRDLAPEEARWVDPSDRAGWVGALRLAMEGAIRRASRETRAKLLTRFSEQEMARRMDRIYRRVLRLV